MRKFLALLLRKLSNKIDKECTTASVLSDKTEVQKEIAEITEPVQVTKPKGPKVKKTKSPRLPELSPQEKHL